MTYDLNPSQKLLLSQTSAPLDTPIVCYISNDFISLHLLANRAKAAVCNASSFFCVNKYNQNSFYQTALGLAVAFSIYCLPIHMSSVIEFQHGYRC